jgi:hypothetical protein
LRGGPLASPDRDRTKEESTLKKLTVAALALAAALAGPTNAAAQATLEVDPVAPCYRERDTVRLPGAGFSQNGSVVFTRDTRPIGDPIVADPSGQVFAQLTLPGLQSGQQRLTYVATDQANPALSAQVSLLVTATDVGLQPDGGAPHRLLTIRARGFFGDSGTVFAHVVRTGRRGGKARNMRIGRVTGPCKVLSARRRLFSRDTPPGKYRVQFDTFRRYKASRSVKTVFVVTVFRTAGTARASALSPASWR